MNRNSSFYIYFEAPIGFKRQAKKYLNVFKDFVESVGGECNIVESWSFFESTYTFTAKNLIKKDADLLKHKCFILNNLYKVTDLNKID